MNKKNNRKGFTTVELVIVIAVIAILATVLIPTFSGLIEKANKSAALQEARAKYAEYINDFDYSNGATPVTSGYITVDGYTFQVTDGKIDADPADPTDPTAPTIPVN